VAGIRAAWWFAWRDLWSNPRALVLTLLAIAGGIVAIVGMTAVIGGLTSHVEDSTVDFMTGHLVVLPVEGETLADARELSRRIAARDGVVGAAPRLEAQGILAPAGAGGTAKAVEVWGIRPRLEADVTRLHDHIASGSHLSSPGDDGAVIGGKLAEALEIEPGDTVTLTLSSGGLLVLTAAGLLRTDVHDLDQGLVLLPADRLMKAQAAGNGDDPATRVIVRLEPGADPARVAGDLAGLRPGLEVREWQELNWWVDILMEMQSIFYGMVLVMAALTAGLATASALLVRLSDRTAHIGMIRAQGASRRFVVTYSLVQGLLLGLLGGLLGTLAGYLVFFWYLVEHPINIAEAEEIYGVSALFVAPEPRYLVYGLLLAVGTAALAALWPAWRASRLDPVRAIRRI